MFGLGPATKIYLAAGATDMRKGFEGLYGLMIAGGGVKTFV
jgi:transposase